MARIRSIKPTFFTDSDLAELSPLHRLAFQGLWCHADKRGRLEDKPRELKIKILPFDEVDFDRLLTDLAKPRGDEPGFIRRYAVNGRRCVYVSRFERHQKPHPKEPESELPEPPPFQIEPGKNTAAQEPAPEKPGQSGGILSLGSGSLVLGAGVPESRPEPAAPPPPKFIPLEYSEPTKPEEQWDDEDFEAWAQCRRVDSGYHPEKRAHHRKRAAWWTECHMQGATARTLKEGFYRFGEDPFWEARDPPYPFAAFMDQWMKYTRKEMANARAS